MTFKPEIFAQEGDKPCAPGNLLPSPGWEWAHLYNVPDVDIPTERDETKPCRPIYCARHYSGEDVPCAQAYHCPGVEK